MSARRTRGGIGRAVLLACGLLAAGSVVAREPEIPEAASPEAVRAGRTALVTSPKGMRYFIRVPRGYDAKDGARLIVFLHGSSMNGLTYLRSFEEAKWCRDDILVCPNGEEGTDPFGQNNFTFQSAPLVADVASHVSEAFSTTRVYLGGHSQGGFVTYSTIMQFPDLFDGAFPMASGCWLQNEPNLWEERPEILVRQKEIAIAHIHGRADPVVPFAQGEHANGVFLAMAYPKLRLLAPEELGHQFLLSPVPEALEWLDAMNGAEADEAMRAAKRWGREGEWGWVHQTALAVLEHQAADTGAVAEAKRAIDAIERTAGDGVGTMADEMENADVLVWLPKWMEFRRQFGATEAAKALTSRYDAARSAERNRGAAWFAKALGHSRNNESEEARRAFEAILAEAPHSFHAYHAWKQLAADDR